MNRASRLALLTLGWLSGCTLFGGEQKPDAPPEERHLDVVDERGPFDPSQAVDDPGEQPGLDVDAEGTRETGPSKAPAAQAGDLRAGMEEDVETPEQAEELKSERHAEVRRTDESQSASDERAKVAIARNPPPSEGAQEDPPFLTAADLAFDALLVFAAAGVVALASALVRRLGRRGRWIGAAAALALAGVAVWWIA